MYPSKPCPYKRAIKINGRMHRMCQFHREQANRNQRRVEARKRAERLRRSAEASPSPCAIPFSTKHPNDHEQVDDGLMPLLDTPLVFPSFSEEEIEMLIADLSRDDWSDLILLD
ncbi:hypothetical protein PINS_up021907 [Pythium insidiosum]|nr:hypothetical protein PINS_up021907 [Pythium insidiosum]